MRLSGGIEHERKIHINLIDFRTDLRNIIAKKVYEPDCSDSQKIDIDAMLHLQQA